MSRCVSPIDGGRCPVILIGDSKFCFEHSAAFRPLYLKYKHLENNIKKLLLKTPLNTSSDIVDILKIYAKLEEAYNRHLQYRKKAFVPVMWDRGHDLWMNKLLDMMKECVGILKQKFDESKDDASEDEVVGISNEPEEVVKGDEVNVSYEDEVDVNKQYKNTKNRLSKIVADEEDFDSLVSEIIKKDVAMLTQKALVYKNLDELLQKTYGLKYIKNFAIFLLLPEVVYLNYYREKSIVTTTGDKVYTMAKYQVYISKIIPINLVTLKYNMMPVFELMINAKIKGVKNQKMVDIVTHMHNIYSKIPDRKRVNIRWLKPYAENILDIPNTDIRHLIPLDAIYLMFTDLQSGVSFLKTNMFYVYQHINDMGDLRKDKAILYYTEQLKSKYKDQDNILKSIIKYEDKVKRKTKIDRLDVYMGVRKQNTKIYDSILESCAPDDGMTVCYYNHKISIYHTKNSLCSSDTLCFVLTNCEYVDSLNVSFMWWLIGNEDIFKNEVKPFDCEAMKFIYAQTKKVRT